MQIPDDLRYSTDHEWVRVEGGKVTDRHHRLRAGRPRRRRVRGPARGRCRGGGRTVRSARSSPPSRSRTSTRPLAGTVAEVNADLARRPGAPQRGSLRRGMDLRDRPSTTRPSSTACSTRRPTEPSSRASADGRPSAAPSAGTATRWPRTSARRAAPTSNPARRPQHDGHGHGARSTAPPRRSRSTSTSCRPASGCSSSPAAPTPGSQFALDEPLVTAGRHPDSEIFLDDITVSRRHAEVRRVGGGLRRSPTSARSTAPT